MFWYILEDRDLKGMNRDVLTLICNDYLFLSQTVILDVCTRKMVNNELEINHSYLISSVCLCTLWINAKCIP